MGIQSTSITCFFFLFSTYMHLYFRYYATDNGEGPPPCCVTVPFDTTRTPTPKEGFYPRLSLVDATRSVILSIPTFQNELARSFSRTVLFSTVHQHPTSRQNRQAAASALIFDDSGCSPPPPSTAIENKQARSFSRLHI